MHTPSDEAFEKRFPTHEISLLPLPLLDSFTLGPRESRYGHLPRSFSVHEKNGKIKIGNSCQTAQKGAEHSPKIAISPTFYLAFPLFEKNMKGLHSNFFMVGNFE